MFLLYAGEMGNDPTHSGLTGPRYSTLASPSLHLWTVTIRLFSRSDSPGPQQEAYKGIKT
jgi:hypothetical protein